MQSLTVTAQAANAAAIGLSQLLTVPLPDLLKYLALGLVGLILIPTVKQHLIELFVAKFNPPLWMKLALPTAFASVSAALLKFLGGDACTPAMAWSAMGIWATMTHLVNESPLALSLPISVRDGLSAAEKVLTDGAKVGALLLVCMLGLGAGLHADVTPTAAPVAGWCAGPSLWAGSALYQTNPEGTLDPEESALAGIQFAGYLGSWSGNSFSPTYTLGLLGAMRTQGGANSPALGVNGGFYLDGVPLTAFVAKDLGAAGGGLLWGIGTSVKFNDYVPFLYLGHPGN